MYNKATMSFSELLFSMSGRISRSTYWLKYFVPYMVVYILMVAIDLAIGTYSPRQGVGLGSGVFTILALYPSIAVSVKRCHDRGRSGWFLLVGIIPLVNIWVMIELGFLRGTVGPNLYGPDPLAA